MIKKLLFLFILTVAINGYSQAIAYPVPNITQCGVEVFNLTVQNNIVLGNQNPTQYSVNYFLSMANAVANTNPISQPSSYVGSMNSIIYIRVTNLQDNSYAVTSFSASWSETPSVAPIADITVCDFYTLPPLPANYQYYTQPNGVGQPLLPGTVVTTTQTIFVWVTNGACSAGTSFVVTITATPATPQMPDVTACDSYTLPYLPNGCSYFTGPNGTGTQIFLSDVITESTTLYVYCENGSCTSENSFTVTILDTPELPQFSQSVSCGPYTLPVLPAGGSYSFNGVPLVGTQPFVITGTGTVGASVGNGICANTVQFLHIDLSNPEVSLSPLHVCDDNGDGMAEFNLSQIVNNSPISGPGLIFTFHETQLDAEAGTNAFENTYFNITPNQTIFVRISTLEAECFTVLPLTLVVDYCSNSQISGTIRFDLDGNGCTASDAPYISAMVSCTNGNDISYAYTNTEGEYSFENVIPGNNILTPIIASMVASPSSQNIAVAGANNSYYADFCVVSSTPTNDVAIYVTPSSVARPGFIASYYVYVSNVGSTILNGSAVLNFNDLMLNYVGASPAASSQTASSLTFDFTNLAPTNFIGYYVTFAVEAPPTVIAGDVLLFTSNVSTTVTDENLENNSYELAQTVVNSYDPNDITCHEGSMVSPNQAQDYLHYTIRFQNTGTADAVNVRLENQLSALLDWSTFQPIASSHTYFAERHGADVVFRFNNIMLPGSSVDEAGSHGFITYRIKPTAAFADPEDIISNSANIFFDFNTPIATNIATTQINFLSTNDYSRNEMVLYPNPVSDVLSIKFGNADVVGISIVDLQGKVVLLTSQQAVNNTAAIDVSGIASGLYFVRVKNGESEVVRKLVVN